MKKVISLILAVLMTFLICPVVSFQSSAVYTEICCEKNVEVSNFTQLKNALENYTTGTNVVLKNNISITDNNNDCSINISGIMAVVLDLNGYTITVNSNATQYLFKVTGQSHLYFVTGKSNRSVIYFNTTHPSAAVVWINHDLAEVSDINIDFTMGSASGYGNTTDSSDSSIFYVKMASLLSIYSGFIRNNMTNGNCFEIASTAKNRQNLNFTIGGNATIQAKKYCVKFDPSYVKYFKFGTVNFESINSDKGLYERIWVPSTSSVTLKNLFYTSAAGSQSTIYVNGGLVTDNSKKLTSISKADINADKLCETVNNTDPFMILKCSAGHVRICGTCNMAFNNVGAHTFKNQAGSIPTCTSDGRSSGQICTDCAYSTSVILPKTGHSITYVAEKAASCGVDGTKAHYYCSSCRGYFKDADGNTSINKDDVIIPNNHRIENLAAKPATCTADGKTAGRYCYTCQREIIKQETISAKGHDYATSWATQIYPNCQSEGLSVKKCKNCTETLEKSIAKTAHEDANGDGKCDFCKVSMSEADKEPNTGNGSSDNNTKDCSCKCHKKGLAKIFFKIILFFQKIFKKNQICVCGEYHY